MWAVSKILILLACTRLSGSRDVMKTSSRENRTRVIREEGVAAGFLLPNPACFSCQFSQSLRITIFGARNTLNVPMVLCAIPLERSKSRFL